MDTQAVGPWFERDYPEVGYRAAPPQQRQVVAVGRASVVEGVSRPPVATRSITPAGVIERIHGDYERALYCRRQAEEYRRRWFAGREREIAYVSERAAGRDPRFRRLTPSQMNLVGRLRWSESGRAQKLAALEERYTRWMRFYLAFAEYQVPIKHVRMHPAADE